MAVFNSNRNRCQCVFGVIDMNGNIIKPFLYPALWLQHRFFIDGA